MNFHPGSITQPWSSAAYLVKSSDTQVVGQWKMPPPCRAAAHRLFSQGYVTYGAGPAAVGDKGASQRCLLSLRELRENPRLVSRSDAAAGSTSVI